MKGASLCFSTEIMMESLDCKRGKKVRLKPWQQMLIKPAIACLQLFATLYMGDLLRPHMAPLVMASLATITFVLSISIQEELPKTMEESSMSV
jgi:hypothetical protein